ncbi:MAG TPA: polysaccharide biosynthesis/export family protein, partial [Terricaulis sp.]|nr:polysaccharide biosynthesis/export family protein [Terricaulis sp.]
MTKPIWHTRRNVLGLLALGAGASALAGCGTTDSTPVDVAERAEYRLGSGDELRVTVYGEAELTGQFRVGSQGTIAYPLVGDVPAAGLTVGEFTTSLQQALLAYIRAPNVSVQVTNYRPFYILGEVQRPGTYEYSTDMTVLNAVATAGGFTYRANRRRVYIRRASETEERDYPLTIATPVLPGDTVRIGERL